ncbi:6-phosphofructokinase [uncultured Desulfosarcina sp.]|uniref:6-phosphofructokinase n=1 Tax=uncultured Desulfosarcina sp. TaxID=218289 RepID=UPI0029C6FC3A|nr:6-phosphofructokinase [uncultured Desulfosarcina sp.]
MPEPSTIRLDKLLDHPAVMDAVADVNLELKERVAYQPPVCTVFKSPFTTLATDTQYQFEIDKEAHRQLSHIIANTVQRVEGCDDAADEVKENYRKARNIGIVFSGGPSPGGHNVIAGLFDAAKKVNPRTRIFGFLMGPDGIIDGDYMELTRERVDQYRNVGGFTMIKTGRTKIDNRKKMDLSRETCKQLELDALVVVGGDDSNTNAAFLAQEMFEDGVQVIGVPKTIDGDIQVRDARGQVLCAMSFGFHTAARAFSQAIANLCTDASSDVKYWHVCKVMGRVASHLALEVALQTHANMTLIGEDLADYVDYARLEKAEKERVVDYTAYGMTLRHLSRVTCDAIMQRAAVGKNYGVLVVPEGVLEFINEIQVFIIKLNTIIGNYNKMHDRDFHSAFPTLNEKLEYLRRLVRGIRKDVSYNVWNARDDELFNDIPEFFQEGLLTERDSHGNFQFSQVKTEKVLLDLVKDYLGILKEKGQYKIGIQDAQFVKTMQKGGLDPERYGPILFENWKQAQYLMIKKTIISRKTLKTALVKAGFLGDDETIPAPIEKIYNQSVPKFKTQTHFYGYDGRGSDPTRFDCIYTYNLGQTVFSLIANGATGQMAAILNLEQDFHSWRPIGIPIAPLMHLEERKGKLELVLEKSIVDVNSPAYRVVKTFRDKWLAATPGEDHYRHPGPIRFAGNSEENRPITLLLNAMGGHLSTPDQ